YNTVERLRSRVLRVAIPEVARALVALSAHLETSLADSGISRIIQRHIDFAGALCLELAKHGVTAQSAATNTEYSVLSQ
ncbi:hypothetical protein KIPB_016889, partial [Kipferlia bialata]